MKSIIPAICVALTLVSCQYKNDDVYVNPISPPSNVDASINLNDVSEPIIIKSPTRFQFSTTPSGKERYEATVSIDGIQTFQLSSATGEFSFVIDPAITGNGSKKLALAVRYSSLSPSLSGQLGIETLVVSRNWDISIDTTPPAPLPSPEVYLEDGKSMVKWTTPSRFTFTDMIVFRSYLDNNGNIIAQDSIKVPDHQTTLIHESSYVGGPVKYRIDLKGYRFYIKGGETDFDVTPLRFTLDSLSTVQKLTYGISPLYNNDIVIYNGVARPPDEPFTYFDDGRFGQVTPVEYRVYANHPPPSFFAPHYYSVSPLIYKGIRILPYSDLEYIPSKNIYLLANSTGVHRIDGTTYEVTGTYTYAQYMGYNLLASDDGQHVYIYDGGIDKLYPFNFENMTVGAAIDLRSITGLANQGLNYEPGISNSNIITFSLASTSKVFAVNANTLQIVWQSTGFGKPIISADADYIYYEGSVYKNENNNWGTLVGTVSQAANAMDTYFKQVSGVDKLVVSTFSFGSIYIYNLNIAAVNGTLNPESDIPYNYQYDRHSQQYLALVNQASWLADGFVYNSVTLEQTKSLLSIAVNPGTAILCNGHIFHSNGFIWP